MRKKNILFLTLSTLWLLLILVVTSFAWISRTWTPTISEDQISISTAGALVISLVSDDEYNSNSAKYNTVNLNEGYKYLNENGYICLEIGYDQKEDVLDLINKSGKYSDVKCFKDLAGNDRVIVINKI